VWVEEEYAWTERIESQSNRVAEERQGHEAVTDHLPRDAKFPGAKERAPEDERNKVLKGARVCEHLDRYLWVGSIDSPPMPDELGHIEHGRREELHPGLLQGPGCFGGVSIEQLSPRQNVLRIGVPCGGRRTTGIDRRPQITCPIDRGAQVQISQNG
jgi:hypothetical protein